MEKNHCKSRALFVSQDAEKIPCHIHDDDDILQLEELNLIPQDLQARNEGHFEKLVNVFSDLYIT